MLVGYARVSTTDQSLDVQLEALSAAGCERIYSEKRTGTSTASRTELRAAIGFVREGDTLIVTRLDRLARSVGDLFRVLEDLSEKGVAFQCLQQQGIDTGTSTGKLLLTVLGAVAAFETDIRMERQAEGIRVAKTRGVYRGRKTEIEASRVKQAAREHPEWGASQLARELGIGRATVYRKLAEPDTPTAPIAGPSLAELIGA